MGNYRLGPVATVLVASGLGFAAIIAGGSLGRSPDKWLMSFGSEVTSAGVE
jgi:hypothetical protein